MTKNPPNDVDGTAIFLNSHVCQAAQHLQLGEDAQQSINLGQSVPGSNRIVQNEDLPQVPMSFPAVEPLILTFVEGCIPIALVPVRCEEHSLQAGRLGQHLDLGSPANSSNRVIPISVGVKERSHIAVTTLATDPDGVLNHTSCTLTPSVANRHTWTLAVAAKCVAQHPQKFNFRVAFANHKQCWP
ncbi:hypothetical protein Q0S19_03555 [Stenotrophomonas indicatrix]|uniref:hypothetical protein n=1 Tax=Stenotrophomonas indicatrix TaxID=2045451 RepID=UPI00264EAFAA|nr:hypothetical protein [Stenotrophomonas indicatrix]MDN8643544.1 hypothetical protein [Stenotrophomonas indicatrix]MDN8655342.1 hypothetical protein [Stenotrophomonas indicatrix]